MRNGGRKRQEEGELTRWEGRKNEVKRENARNIERRDGEKGQDEVREGEETSGGNHRGVCSVPPTRLRRPVCHSFELIS